MSKICPRCGVTKLKPIEVHNALSRTDNETFICSACGMQEAVESIFNNLTPQSDWPVKRTESESPDKPNSKKPSHQERTRAAVYATGNKWAIENFEATHN